MIRAVLLDAGGTLFHRVPSTAAVVAEVLSRHGRSAPEEAIHRAFHRAVHGEGVPEPGEEAAAWRRFNELLLSEIGIPPSPNLVSDLEHALENGKRAAYPDVLSTLDALCAEGVRLVVVSNFTHALPKILDDVGVTPRIDALVYSWKAGVAKPDPRIYALGLAAAGVRPTEALMVGDSFEHDVAGAKACGIDAVLLDREGREPGALRSLAAILPLVRAARSPKP